MVKIAIIEDNDAVAAMYEFKLTREGYITLRATNGIEGLKLIKEHEPDVILLDLLMPLMTGDEMLERLRATKYGSKVRVIILTNISKSEAPMRLRFLNVDRYIVKAHHTPTQVADIVKELIAP